MHARKVESTSVSLIDIDEAVDLAEMFRLLGDPTRIRILFALFEFGELCVCDLADLFDITQPSASRHLRLLREKALVQSRRDAQTIYYSVCLDNPFARLLVALFSDQEADKITLALNGEALV